MSITSISEQAILSSPVKTTSSMLEHLTTMRSPPVLFRTAEMMAKSKLILKMPTITQHQRVVMKILPTQQSSAAPPQQLPVHKPLASQPSMPERLNTVPRFINSPCGQFNPESDDYLDLTNTDNTLINGYTATEPLIDGGNMRQSLSQEDNSQLSQSMETQNIMDLDFTSLGTMNADDLFSPSIEKPAMSKIDLQKANQHLMLCLNDNQIMSLITPETEKSCFAFLHSNIPPTASIIHEKDLKNLILESDLVDKLVLSASALQAGAENPFQFSASDHLSDNEMRVLERLENELTAEIAREECVALDHGYSAAPKRKLSQADSDDECTFDSEYPSSVASSSVSQLASTSKKGEPKKKRQRGIYRLEDVTNEEERRNYMERRMKNNISSKASRANKKSYFGQLESSASHLESENARLSKQISTLDSHIKEIKNFLITKFNTK